MTEAAFKSRLVKVLRQLSLHVFRIEDKFTYGIPDMCVIGNNITSWWEIKKDKIIGNGKKIQQKRMKDLMDHTEFSYYIVFTKDDIQIRDYFLDMKKEPKKSFKSIPELVEYIYGVHYGF